MCLPYISNCSVVLKVEFLFEEEMAFWEGSVNFTGDIPLLLRFIFRVDLTLYSIVKPKQLLSQHVVIFRFDSSCEWLELWVLTHRLRGESWCWVMEGVAWTDFLSQVCLAWWSIGSPYVYTAWQELYCRFVTCLKTWLWLEKLQLHCFITWQSSWLDPQVPESIAAFLPSSNKIKIK